MSHGMVTRNTFKKIRILSDVGLTGHPATAHDRAVEMVPGFREQSN